MSSAALPEKNNMTTGPEWRRLLLFALPIMAGQFLQQLYNTVDGIVVGRYVSAAALGAVGSCTTLAFLFLAVALGLGNGCGIFIAQLFGAQKTETLKRAVATALILFTGLGIAFSALGFFAVRWFVVTLLRIREAHLIALSVGYFKVYALGLLFQFLYNCIASMLRAVGVTQATLYFPLVSAVGNLILDLLFVAKFRWGIVGAAAATVIFPVRLCDFLFQLLFRKIPYLSFSIK